MRDSSRQEIFAGCIVVAAKFQVYFYLLLHFNSLLYIYCEPALIADNIMQDNEVWIEFLYNFETIY